MYVIIRQDKLQVKDSPHFGSNTHTGIHNQNTMQCNGADNVEHESSSTDFNTHIETYDYKQDISMQYNITYQSG